MKINTISPQDNNYLQIITTIAKVPEKFYFIGRLPEKRIPTVAIVGSRKPTAYGKEVTYKLSYDLTKKHSYYKWPSSWHRCHNTPGSP